MPTGIGPEVVIDPPPLTPPPSGLLLAATVIDHTEDDNRWVNGLRLRPEHCEDARTFDPCTGGDVTLSFADGVTTQGSTTLTSATAAFSSTDLNKSLSSSTTVTATYADGSATALSTTFTSATAAFGANDVGLAITSAATANFTAADGVTNTDTSFVSATAAFNADDVGKTITGTGIPGATTISSVTNATTVVLSAATTASATGVSFTITARKVIPAGITIASVTNATTIVLSDSGARATASSVSFSIGARPVLAAATTISSVTNATTVVLSTPAAGTSSAASVTFASRDTAPTTSAPITFLPFGVEAFDTCSTYGYQRADYEGRARRALAARETKAVEKELATGALMGNRHLQDSVNTTVLNGGVAFDFRTALSALVQAIADNNLGVGMIHARPSLVTLWSSDNLLRWQNGKLYTLNGNLVVPGAGYPGASPSGSAPTSATEWAYATDVLQVHRGPVEVFVPEADHVASMRRSTNEITVRAQRMYAVVGNFCTVIGVNVSGLGQ